MQTKPEAEVGALSGARQVPLLSRDQIIPGIIFTGIAADHVHEVVSVEGDTVTLQRLPRTVVTATHTHAFTLFENTTCRCGVGRRPITVLMPEDGRTPRAHVLVPLGPLVVPDTCSIYAFAGSRTLAIHGGTQTVVTEIPIVLKTWKIWSLPEACRRLIAAQQSAME